MTINGEASSRPSFLAARTTLAERTMSSYDELVQLPISVYLSLSGQPSFWIASGSSESW